MQRRANLFPGIAGGLVLAAVFGVLLFEELRARTLPELMQMAQADPKDASLQVDLGDAYFATGRRIPALEAYDRALQLDRSVATGRMLENLVACFGTREMRPAGAIITQYRLEGSEDGLRALISDDRRWVRNAAIDTLAGLKKARRDDFLTVYTLDLASADCDIRRRAVEKLGKLGDRRALGAIRAANQKDEASTPWYAFSCLGDRPEDAEQRILASR